MSDPSDGTADAALPVPEGFEPVTRPGLSFMQMIGPTYIKRVGPDATPIIGMRMQRKHLNMRGIVHGGLLVTLADSALATALNHARKVPLSMVTVSLTTDFVQSAQLGDWVEAHVDVQRVGVRMAFANCYLVVGERRILRASGVFAVVAPAAQAAGNKSDA